MSRARLFVRTVAVIFASLALYGSWSDAFRALLATFADEAGSSDDRVHGFAWTRMLSFLYVLWLLGASLIAVRIFLHPRRFLYNTLPLSASDGFLRLLLPSAVFAAIAFLLTDVLSTLGVLNAFDAWEVATIIFGSTLLFVHLHTTAGLRWFAATATTLPIVYLPVATLKPRFASNLPGGFVFAGMAAIQMLLAAYIAIRGKLNVRLVDNN